jgi:histidinol dehydrogenase
MKVFRAGTPDFHEALGQLNRRNQEGIVESVQETVKNILQEVRLYGDEALVRYTERWDGFRTPLHELELPRAELDHALDTLAPDIRRDLSLAIERIQDFHKRQVIASWQFEDEQGNLLGQKVTPLDRVGVYIPGGKAAYPSSVLMNVVPAKVAGVGEIIAVTPPRYLSENKAVLAALRLSGVDRVFRVGGAQAIAALAFGTARIPRVDKIVGPGNLYVAIAKRLVFGSVDIDMVAGPSEILIVTDGSSSPDHLAADLLAQAEHDEHAVPLLISTSEPFLDEVLKALDAQLVEGPWATVASTSILRHGMAFLVGDLSAAVEMANVIAPEHLELAIRQPETYLHRIRHAGAIFLGPRSAETLGDYVAGPNHVLPTMGTARFFSPLGVYDFVKRSSILSISPQGLQHLGPTASRLARLEGLPAHARAVERRLEK